MKTNIKRISDFVTASRKYIEENEDETKLLHAIKRVLEKASACISEYWDLQEDININFANTDHNGSILYTVQADGKREYQYSKESIKQRDAQSRELLNVREFEIEEYIVNELPKSFNEDYRPYFKGFVLE